MKLSKTEYKISIFKETREKFENKTKQQEIVKIGKAFLQMN